jgi:nucleotide-binding universal stress UspA family protein
MKTVILPPARRLIRTSIRVKTKGSLSKKLKIQRVLEAIDFSPASWEALEFVAPLLKHFGAEVHLAHVFAPEYPLATAMAMPLMLSGADIERSVCRQLKKGASKCSSAVPLENVHALKGRPFREICALARKIDADLIVISTRGLSGFKHIALGSTAERVVRYSPCPVLVVRPIHDAHGRNSNGEAHAALAIRKILVPVDFSDCSRRGVEFAKCLAKQSCASLVLLHSVYFQYYVSSDEYARYDYPLFVQEADKAARIRMRELIWETKSEGIKVEPLLKTGHVGEQICSSARSHGIDLIVTSTHGWTGFKHVLLGSNAEYVVQHATCSVLVVPTHQRPGVDSTTSKK